MKIEVNEIFHSIQGEGPNTGKPAVFLRLSGCNLRCKWCDTKYAWKKGKKMTTDQIIQKIKKYFCKHLVITGGEPLLQQDALKELLKKLKSYTAELETNGSIACWIIGLIEQINCSPKLKNSGVVSYPLKIKPDRKTIYKFVVTTESGIGRSRPQELNEIKRFIKKYKIPKTSVYLMPEGTSRTPLLKRSKWLVERCKKEGYNFSPRLHIMLNIK